MSNHLIVVGAGIVGLANAWEAARKGWRVTVVERDSMARGASVRNFGMFSPICQSPGRSLELALSSRERWLEITAEAGLWNNPGGKVFLALQEDEMQVMLEFSQMDFANAYEAAFLSASEMQDCCPVARKDKVLGGLFLATEMNVDPRQAISVIPNWLGDTFGVEFYFDAPVIQTNTGEVVLASGNRLGADLVIVCSGTDTRYLYPGLLEEQGVQRCKLQMMRTVQQTTDFNMGPMVAGGMSMGHYKPFSACPSLPALMARYQSEEPELARYGIHAMASQSSGGELVMGDSHLYDDEITPFDIEDIDRCIINRLREMIYVPDWTIAERWHGIYMKHPEKTHLILPVNESTYVISATGGTGMTLAFGVARACWKSGSFEPDIGGGCY